MKKVPLAIVLVLLAAAGVALWLDRRADGEESAAYRFATVERRDIESAVSATGALGAVTTVQVGTQVSGQVAATFADFNDAVKKGQLIARIDPTLQQQAVRDAQAGLERAQAELEQADREYQRNRQLFERKVLTDVELGTARYAFAVARAAVKSAQVTLDRARQNLAYTSIHAPIDGVVVERNVAVGQTVAASLSAPQLFLIAADLTRMQILASVDESDIGLIREGQPARFSVQAYPGRSFAGTVRQVRLQSTTTENVVNYTVVVAVENPDGKLLPGMTATVDFLTGAARDVLTVPNSALRFRPTPAMLERAGEPRRSSDANAATSDRPAGADGRQDVRRPRTAPSAARLWHLDQSGRPAVMRVRTGITDGQHTQVEGAGLAAGMQVIVGVTQSEPQAGITSPFQSQPPAGPQRPGGF